MFFQMFYIVNVLSLIFYAYLVFGETTDVAEMAANG